MTTDAGMTGSCHGQLQSLKEIQVTNGTESIEPKGPAVEVDRGRLHEKETTSMHCVTPDITPQGTENVTFLEREDLCKGSKLIGSSEGCPAVGGLVGSNVYLPLVLLIDYCVVHLRPRLRLCT